MRKFLPQGIWLREKRAETGISVREVAAEVGVSTKIIKLIEQGRNRITAARVQDFARGYGMGKKDMEILIDEMIEDYKRSITSEISD